MGALLAVLAFAVLFFIGAWWDERVMQPRQRARQDVLDRLAAQQETLLCTHIYAGGRCPRQCGRPTERVTG